MGNMCGNSEMLHSGEVGNRLFSYLESRGGCRDGVLSWDEFVPFLNQVGWPFPAAQQAWWEADTNRSGSLSRAEFLRFCARPNVRGYIMQMEATFTGHAGNHVGFKPMQRDSGNVTGTGQHQQAPSYASTGVPNPALHQTGINQTGINQTSALGYNQPMPMVPLPATGQTGGHNTGYNSGYNTGVQNPGMGFQPQQPIVAGQSVHHGPI